MQPTKRKRKSPVRPHQCASKAPQRNRSRPRSPPAPTCRHLSAGCAPHGQQRQFECLPEDGRMWKFSAPSRTAASFGLNLLQRGPGWKQPVKCRNRMAAHAGKSWCSARSFAEALARAPGSTNTTSTTTTGTNYTYYHL